jgi:hypothetical protein
MDGKQKLWWVRAAHTVIWFVFAASILAIPVTTFLGRLYLALGLTLFAMIEVVALVTNHMRCPLRDVAGRYTEDRSDGFDIFLPGWLAGHTKQIFTPILIVSVLWLGWRWFAG